MQRQEPRNLRGLVQTKNMAEFLGVSENTIRAWRKRNLEWADSGRKETSSVHAHFPAPIPDPQDPQLPFLINGGPVYDVAAVMLFKDYYEQHERKAGNPQWIRAAETA